jgi:hypothetical protein
LVIHLGKEAGAVNTLVRYVQIFCIQILASGGYTATKPVEDFA